MSTATVFIVDEHPGVRREITRLLQTEGYDVRGFGSAREFLAQHDPNRPGCLIFEVMISDMSGLQLQEYLTARGRHQPIIFITSRTDISSSIRAMKGGAVNYLTKPFGTEELLAAVQEALAIDAVANVERGTQGPVPKLGEFASVSAGFNAVRIGHTTTARSSRFAVIALKDVTRNVAPLESLATLEALPEQVGRFRVEPGDVIVTTRGADIRAAVVEETHAGAIAGTNLARIRLRSSLLRPTLLAAFLREPRTQERLLRDTTGASTPGFTINALTSLPICIPSPRDQGALVRLIEAAAAYREELLRAIELRQLICSEMISRQLIPRDGQ
jgi:DNA-binding response OmpR family regulator